MTKVARNSIETTILEGLLCSGHKLSLGPDHVTMYTKWTNVARNSIETAKSGGVLV